MIMLSPAWRFVIFGLGASFLASCKPSDTSPPATAAGAGTIAYDMRGVIERLGTAAAPRRLHIHHEATKDMESMTMSFSIDNNVDLTGLAVGDKIAFRYEIDQKTFEEHVTKVEKLPAETVLNLAEEPTTATSPAAGTMKGTPGM